jgi:hypothetical protein
VAVRRPWLVPAAIFIVCFTLTTHGKFSVSGDEPHYLAVAQSLASDFDLDLRNDYLGDRTRRFGVESLDIELHARETLQGRLYSVHDIGVPVALAPGYLVATAIADLMPERLLRTFRMTRGLFAYSLIALLVIGVTTAAAVLTRSALVAGGAPAGIAGWVVLVVWLVPPVISNSFLVFPEPFALLATAGALRAYSAPPAVGTERRAMLALAVALGLLPWFHRKFAAYGFAMLIVLAWRHRRGLAATTRTDRALAVALFLAPQILLAAWTWQNWGSVSGPLVADRVPFSLEAFQKGWLGLLVDRENGLFVWAPIYLLLPAGWWAAGRRAAPWLLPALALFLVSAAHDLWWGGFSPAGRFLMPLAPISCLAGVAVAQTPLLRRLFFILAVPQLVITAYGWQNPRALWPRGDGRNRLMLSLGLGPSIDGILPSLRAAVPSIRGGAATVAAIAAANAAIGLFLQKRSAGHLGRRRDAQ